MEFFKYAIVDIGANSVRMIIYDIDTENGRFYPVDSVRNLLGLAAYNFNAAIKVSVPNLFRLRITSQIVRSRSYATTSFPAGVFNVVLPSSNNSGLI